MAEAVQTAGKANKVILILGLPDRFESEGYDRKHLRIPSCQIELIDRIYEVNKNIAVVLYNGAPVEMPWLHKVKALVEAYLCGEAVGQATADVLFGRVNPSGHLPETFPLRLEDTPCFLTYNKDVRKASYSEDVFVGYRYYDTRKTDVLFPFGFGLSYTTFDITNIHCPESYIQGMEKFVVTADVVNTGVLKGKAVIQLYIAPVNSNVPRPSHELRAFDKIELMPGETKAVVFELEQRDFSYWDCQTSSWLAEQGNYRIEIGFSSRDIVCCNEITLISEKTSLHQYTVNTTIGELMNDPVAVRILTPYFNIMRDAFGMSQQKSETDRAMNDDMANAMFANLPLRSISSFADSKADYDTLSNIIEEINRILLTE